MNIEIGPKARCITLIIGLFFCWVAFVYFLHPFSFGYWICWVVGVIANLKVVRYLNHPFIDGPYTHEELAVFFTKGWYDAEQSIPKSQCPFAKCTQGRHMYFLGYKNALKHIKKHIKKTKANDNESL